MRSKITAVTMNFRPTRRLQFTALALLVLGGAVVGWWEFSGGGEGVREEGRSPGVEQRLAVTVPKGQLGTEKAGPGELTKVASETLKLTDEELRKVEAALGPVQELLRGVDAANAESQIDKVEGSSRIVALRLNPPDVAQISRLYDALTQAGRNFQKESSVGKEFRRRADQLVRGMDSKSRIVVKSVDLASGIVTFVQATGGKLATEANGATSITGDSMISSRQVPERFRHLFPEP
jgi:hypothetical protein